MSNTRQHRAKRELKTVSAMIRLYCLDNHGMNRDLCTDCTEIWEYAQIRVTYCPLLPDKPTCTNCPVHCYKNAMRERIKVIMRYSGPRMMWRHPILALLHFAESLRDRQRASIKKRLASRGRKE